MSPSDPADWLLLCRTVRFGDTDAAGVMHFHQLLRWCHEAYEESLERFGVVAGEIFPGPGRTPVVALPIVHVSADYRRPLACGDPLAIELRPQQRDGGSFEIRYRFLHNSQEAATGLTRHVAIEASSRRRTDLPASVLQWLEASRTAS
ncbi:thioesterase family protein [Cyanobium gracile UHCC 0139]|uniref:1,4-dihydroxy-2-naphthoyl-CoA hydrolase n=1 Tax=Cyanobium gracile UHCC 0139 TaxID=3110308 RepID=A0ABU5RNP2_9CYAN|nr:thioesterase family protein [Cyanobium gracile]MEA5389704.1 thioesterase family protein [Cyanobium gracile UHCC 0139]